MTDTEDRATLLAAADALRRQPPPTRPLARWRLRREIRRYESALDWLDLGDEAGATMRRHMFLGFGLMYLGGQIPVYVGRHSLALSSRVFGSVAIGVFVLLGALFTAAVGERSLAKHRRQLVEDARRRLSALPPHVGISRLPST